ncbi:DUF1826 domain-containing protein [Roseibium polysiphoniae]|uniref:DUF1826 domain-containing protein n=1 Tax=Roseibium polysiphoniae TaxID=2571221 RepID=A0ABR9C9R4_9HYPH|nr:DUF1826 domain-containing protein [Roseibium polysiphoniae]MBD8876343.1 DUF1826 domain-containing protein [Roseibium polysiphoniae]
MSGARELALDVPQERAAAASWKPFVACDVLHSRQQEVLHQIAEPGVAAAIWQRPVDPGFQSWIDTLAQDELPTLRTVVPAHLAKAALLHACEMVGLEPSPEREFLIEDAGNLALAVGKTLNVRYVRIRLDVTSGTMCPKFHVDQVRARLLCSYRGAGTEYVAEADAADPARHKRMATGEVGLFRGALWSDEETCGLLHRSPHQDAGDAARLLLVVEPAE